MALGKTHQKWQHRHHQSASQWSSRNHQCRFQQVNEMYSSKVTKLWQLQTTKHSLQLETVPYRKWCWLWVTLLPAGPCLLIDIYKAHISMWLCSVFKDMLPRGWFHTNHWLVKKAGFTTVTAEQSNTACHTPEEEKESVYTRWFSAQGGNHQCHLLCSDTSQNLMCT